MTSQVHLPNILSLLDKIPGVGDSEFSIEEREYILDLAHNKTRQAGQEYAQQMQYNVLENARVPASVGRYRAYEYEMPQDQQPYEIDDNTIQHKFNRLFEQDKNSDLEDGHSMVVACSAQLNIDHRMELQDKPACDDERIVLFVCGGGFVKSDVPVAKWYYLRMSQELGQRLFVPKYSVAPKHVFPRPVHDVYTAYNHLLARGFRQSNITLCANSAGGSIAVAMMLLLNACKRHMPSGCILIAPLLDLTMLQDSWKRNEDNCVLSHVPLSNPKCLSRVYHGPAENTDTESLYKTFRHPLLSPLFSTELSCLPPLQIQVGEHDVLLDDSRHFAQKLNQIHGSSPECASHHQHAELITYPERNHFSIMRGRSQLDKVYGNMRRFVDTISMEKKNTRP
ncbi:hypothetical protein H4S06_000728 [Coemansia sp. BCRC 34490]|nr:hypothetical protein H4S06_000728 [Coemansia sp. BCRC 34490]